MDRLNRHLALTERALVTLEELAMESGRHPP